MLFLAIFRGNNTTTSSNDNSAKTSAHDSQSAPSAPVPPTCSDDWALCKDNADLVNNSLAAVVDAKVACKEEVAAQAKFGDPKWCSGWFCQDFGKFRTGDDAPKTGVLTLIDDKVQLQNGFGAWAHVTAVCTYDLRAKSVENVSIEQQE